MRPSRCFKHPSITTSLSFLLFIYSCNYYIDSLLVTVIALLLSTLFILSKNRQETSPEIVVVPSPEIVVVPSPEIVVVPSPKFDEELKPTDNQEEQNLQLPDQSFLETKLSGHSASECSNSSTSSCDDDSMSPEDARRSIEYSETSLSDDENFFELALPEGHYLGDQEEGKKLTPSAVISKPLMPELRVDFLQNLLPELVFRQHGLLKELLCEINEEDNLIEIDVVKGSIKSSRLGIS